MGGICGPLEGAVDVGEVVVVAEEVELFAVGVEELGDVFVEEGFGVLPEDGEE